MEYDELASEAALQTKNNKLVKSAMKSTFPNRRRWVLEEAPAVSEVIEKFPVDKELKTKYVSS